MSELIEKVHDAVCGYCIHTGEAVNGKCADCGRITRAAIAAVLKHLADNVSDEMAKAAVEESKQIVVTGMPEAHIPNVKRVLAAALRAAGDGR